jgi:hypothetical protein
LAGLVFLLLAACDERSAPPLPTDLPPPAPAASLARLLGVDAGELEAPVDPPAPPGDLKAEIEQFTTLDACAADRARLDPLLGDALEAIGYDTFLRDACRIIDAAKANDPAKCSAIDASALEAQCRATVAQVAASPDACPWEAPGRPARGRDARCVAVASRDIRLCAAARDGLERATCEATLGTDARRPCASLRARSEQARCARDAARWRGVAGGQAVPAPADAPPVVPAGSLHVESLEAANAANASGMAGGPLDVDLRPDLEHGVTLVVDREGTRFVVGPLTDTGLDFVAPSPHVRGSLALELLVPAGTHAAPIAARVERAELVVPGRPPAATPGARSTLAAKVDKLAATRGAPLTVAVDGDISVSGSSWRVRAQATTFVRDVVKANDVYGAGAAGPRFGVDAGLR